MTRMIMGVQPVREAIRAHGSAIEKLWVEKNGGPPVRGLLKFASDRGIPTEIKDGSELLRAAAGGRHQGVIAFAPELELLRVADLLVQPTSIFVALDGIMDPQNFGAVIRSAVALGADAVLWPEHSSAPLTPATFRASAGAVEHARLCRVPSLPEALVMLAEKGTLNIGLDANGPVMLSQVPMIGPVTLVIGAEDKGLRKPVIAACAHVARLPMRGPISSLNASVAGALALYEVLRQRQLQSPNIGE